MISNIINSDKISDIIVEKYQFGKIDIDDSNLTVFDENIFKTTKEKIVKKAETSEEESKEATELFEKIETLTSQIVTLQMELDEQIKDSQEKLEIEKQNAFDEGKKDGINETTDALQNDNEELKSQLIRSITLLDEQKNSFDEMFKNIEEDLVESAIVIAKKVIKKEVDENSAKIAKTIATALIHTIKSVANITIKVNPQDFPQISEHFNQDSIKIEADEAISRGGVIILSDTINIDGTITTRLNYAIDLIGEEK